MQKVIEPVIASLGLIALIILYIAAVSYQNGSPLGEAFGLLRWGAYVGIASMVLVLAWCIWKRPKGLRLSVLIISAILGFAAFFMPYRYSQIGASVPAIHDITTDTIDPPAFVAIAPLRADAPNPAAYDGPETAQQQLVSYPDIETLTYNQTPDTVFAAARAVVEAMGWELVAANQALGRIEATDTTRWFKFKDDVVIRISASGDSTEVDVRSKSRVGRNDFGVNAGRVRDFSAALNAELGM
ncbi:MAG: DUF1499 domain-containing protein [Pseudohongiellaceae bacterium]